MNRFSEQESRQALLVRHLMGQTVNRV